MSALEATKSKDANGWAQDGQIIRELKAPEALAGMHERNCTLIVVKPRNRKGFMPLADASQGCQGAQRRGARLLIHLARERQRRPRYGSGRSNRRPIRERALRTHWLTPAFHHGGDHPLASGIGQVRFSHLNSRRPLRNFRVLRIAFRSNGSIAGTRCG